MTKIIGRFRGVVRGLCARLEDDHCEVVVTRRLRKEGDGSVIDVIRLPSGLRLVMITAEGAVISM